MTEHNLTLEVFYDGTWHRVEVLTQPAVTFTRGGDGGNDTEPSAIPLTIHDPLGMWAPRYLGSPLYGKIGLNTPARLTVDGSIRLSGQLADWVPVRPVKGSSRTTVQLAGVLRRLGRGRDPLKPALERASLASGPVDYWSLGDGKQATTGANSVSGGQPALPRPGMLPPAFNGLDGALVPAGLAALPTFGAGTVLGASVRATDINSWRMELVFAAQNLPASTGVRVFRWTTGGGITSWELSVSNFLGDQNLSIRGTSPYLAGSPFGQTIRSTDLGDPTPIDGQVHHVAMDVEQLTSSNMAYAIYFDGVLETSGTNTTGALIGRPQVGPPIEWEANPEGDAVVLSVGGVGFWSPHPVAPVDHAAFLAYVGETVGNRFLRFCAELDITGTVVGSAADTVAMGPQTTAPTLDQLDEMARTDDGRIFETRADAAALTLRTGASILNQTPALSLFRRGGILPPLLPVYGDRGVRNDVTANAPDGSSGRWEEPNGPRGITAIGRYSSSWDTNPQSGYGLVDAAGWRVNTGTWDGTWYADVTVSLDAAPGLTAAVNAVDIGDVINLGDLLAEEALEAVDLLVVGITEDLPAKTRDVTFHCVAYGPYRVGKLATDVGDTDPFVGYLDPDTATVAAGVAAGAASFTVNANPLWITSAADADSFPQDVIVGGQRVTISAVTGAAAPQTFTVSTAAGTRPVAYPIPTNATVLPYQPIILAL